MGKHIKWRALLFKLDEIKTLAETRKRFFDEIEKELGDEWRSFKSKIEEVKERNKFVRDWLDMADETYKAVVKRDD